MNLRNSLTSLALGLTSAVGCASARPETHAAAPANTLVAFTHATSDVAVTGTLVGDVAVKVERIPEALLRDAEGMMTLRVSWERQIGTQVGALPEARYRNQVRPLLARALESAGLSPLDVDGILASVDYHRSL
jgi:hypothetical protein